MALLRRVLASPLFHVTLLTLLLAAVFLRTKIIPQDNHYEYQRFIETLAAGRIDFSIPGFQGGSFLALPLYLLTRSPLTHTLFQIGAALLLPLTGFFTAKALLRDTTQAILFASALTLMPFFTFIAFRGFNFPSFTLFLLLTLLLRAKGSRWAWLTLSISILIKPFSVALFPFFLLWEPRPGRARLGDGRVQFALAMILPVLYVSAEYLQIGRIIVGTHVDIGAGNVFQWTRLPLNMLHGVQMLFSVHNFYFVDQAKTGLGNLVHSSPLLMVLGCLSFLAPKDFWKDRRLARVLGLSAVFAFLLAAMLDHMDHFYMETAVLLLTLGSIPVLMRYRILIPLALLTLHFQFFYLYLMWKGTYFTDPSLFAVPLVIDAVALLVWAVFVAPGVRWKDLLRWFLVREGKHVA